MPHRQLFAVTLVALVVCCGTVGAAPVPDIHYYTVSVDYTMSRLWVEARFSPSVHSVTARSRNAGKLLIDARDCDNSEQIRLRWPRR